MSITQLPLLSGLKSSLQWHQQRQKVLAENIANVDTPGYRGKDLKAMPTPDASGRGGPTAPRLVAALTSPRHIPLAIGTGPFGTERPESFEVTPDANGVDIEEQMVKSGQNQIDFQAVAALYQRSLGMIRTAIGRRGG